MTQPWMRNGRCKSVPIQRSNLKFARCCVIAGLITLMLGGCAQSSRQSNTGLSGMFGVSKIRSRIDHMMGNEDESPLEMGRRFSAAERREVEVCRLTYERGQYDDAIKRCRKAAKKFKESSLGEEAQFYLAESWFALGRYAKAQDGYDQLFADYPSTRYVEPATRRLFSIAQTWLEIAEPAVKSEIRTVSAERIVESKSEEKPSDPTLRVRILPNFHDRSRPIFDTQGRALQCLKAIWMNDPTGPLADDSLMLTAAHYQRHLNYVEADRYYEILREEYPDSRHVESAFVLGAHVKQMSYQGPYYEGEDLVGARRLKEQSRQLFPASQHQAQLRKDLDALYLQEAERLWAMVEYYRMKNRPRAIAIACVKLVSEFPDTGYAAEASRILRSIDRKELAGLPEVTEFLDSLPKSAPSPVPENRSGSPVKSVSQPANAGRARL